MINGMSSIYPNLNAHEASTLSDHQRYWSEWLSAFTPRKSQSQASSTDRKEEAKRWNYANQQTEESQSKSINGQQELSEQEKQKVSQLKETDRKVRAHEQAHVRAGGDLIRGMAQYSYEIGPDKKRYAVTGEVSIDTSPVKDDPEATLQKANRIKKAALAPADPSPQDRAVAAEADAMAVRARQELARAQQAQTSPASGKMVNIQV